MIWIVYLPVQVILTLTGISWASAQLCDGSTTELLASPQISSYVTSPNYPFNYPPSTTCKWIITAPTGYIVELTFIDFDTEGGISFRNYGCSSYSDNLEIYNGLEELDNDLLGKYCTSYLPPNVYSSGTSLFLKFKSDEYREKSGFKIKYSAMVPKPDPSICSPFNTFSQNNAIKYSGSSGYIKSPLYGTKYPSNMQCTWVITVSKGKKIKLTFFDFNVGEYQNTCWEHHDYIEIRDGQFSTSSHIESLCSSNKPSPVYSTGRHMWIRFNSNSDNYLGGNRKTNGFKAEYEEEMSDETGTIIGVVIAVIVVIAIIVICTCIKRRRSPGQGHMPRPAITQTTLNWHNQNPGNDTTQYPQQIGGASYPHVRYSPAPQGSYSSSGQGSGHPPPPQSSSQVSPPPGSYPPSTASVHAVSSGGYPPQSSVPMNNHPSQQTFVNDPPPAYPDVVPDVPPPPYPGNPSQIPSTGLQP